MKKYNSIIAMVLVILFIMGDTVPVIGNKETSTKIEISNKEDLIKFAKNCSYDKWSRDKLVVLKNDIELENKEFASIPIFSGVFDGQGYTIKGLNINIEGSNYGLFRYLEKEGKIKNLSVEGSISPKGHRSNIGGIVGYNKGTIENTHFQGEIKGKDSVGGIAGLNGNTGIIIGSSSSGSIYGETKVGGIVGFNSGSISKTVNKSKVNTTIEKDLGEENNISLDNINISRLTSDSMDIGGIVGLNTGVITDAENIAKVGYESKGYNIGGIAGRQSGYIGKSINKGNIFGRKDVGGIVGQMEPYVKTVIPPSKLEKLKKEMNILQGYMTDMINTSKASSGIVSENLLQIQTHIDGGQKHIESLIGQTENLINKDIEEINRINIIALELIGDIDSISESFLNTGKIIKTAIKPLKESLIHISKAMKGLSDFSDEYKILSKIMDGAIEDLDLLLGKMDDLSRDLNKILTILEKLINNSNLGDLLEALIGGQITIDEFLEKMELGDLDLEGIEKILEEIEEGSISLEEAISLIINLLNKELFELVTSLLENLEEILEEVRLIIDKLNDSGQHISNIIDSLGQLGSEMKVGLDYLVEAIDIMEAGAKDMDAIGQGISQMLKKLSSQEALEFQTTDEEYERTKENIFSSLDNISKSMTIFIKNMDRETNTIMDHMQRLSDQLFKVMNLLFSIIEDLSFIDLDPMDKIEDISDKDIEDASEGKVDRCNNLGTIKGDINIGGIAGTMGIEVEFDPEEDLNLKNRIAYDTVYQTRVLILYGRNQGNIVAKKDNAGGIVGSQDLGYLKEARAEGSIKSTNGSYIGGIAGQSKGPIVSSYSKVELAGKNYVGGIVGFGREVVDSYSLVNIREASAYIGAIAGNIDINSNKIENNFFVSKDLQGIDGISYEKKTEKISYGELIAIKAIPNIFREFKLEFWAGENLIKAINFDYGDSLSEKDFPEILDKKGHYGRWEEFKINDLIFDGRVNAQYLPYISLLASDEKEDQLSIFLVEGEFKDKDSINLSRKDPAINLGDKKIMETWQVHIPEDGNESHTIRYKPPKTRRNIGIYILNNKKWEKVKYRQDGKYLVFEARRNLIDIGVVDEGLAIVRYIIFSLIFSILVVALFIGYRRKKENKIEEKSK